MTKRDKRKKDVLLATYKAYLKVKHLIKGPDESEFICRSFGKVEGRVLADDASDTSVKEPCWILVPKAPPGFYVKSDNRKFKVGTDFFERLTAQILNDALK